MLRYCVATIVAAVDLVELLPLEEFQTKFTIKLWEINPRQSTRRYKANHFYLELSCLLYIVTSQNVNQKQKIHFCYGSEIFVAGEARVVSLNAVYKLVYLNV